MSKKIAAGDTLTVWDLTDDYLGAEIEVGPIEGMRTRMTLDRIEEAYTDVLRLFTPEGGYKAVSISRPVKIITPPPVAQPDEPTELGQCIRIEGVPGFLGIVVGDTGDGALIRLQYAPDGPWLESRWDHVTTRADGRQIIVSDPPRWPDDTPVVPERVEAGEWPADDEHLRDYKWIDREGDSWTWRDREYGGLGWGITSISSYESPLAGPWTRGERIK